MGASFPDPQSLRQLGARPQTPTAVHLSCTSLLEHASQSRHFDFLTLVNQTTAIGLPFYQRWSRAGRKVRGQGLNQGHKKNPRPKAKDSPTEDRPSRGQGQECSRPRPRTKDTRRKCSPKKRSSKIFFRRSPKEENKKDLRKFSAWFLAFSYIILKMNKSLLRGEDGLLFKNGTINSYAN